MFRHYVKIALVLVYLVITAGAVVRMTGSGMGCPDWPKCFGYLVPPTECEQLEWHPNQEYHKGEVIIVSESLRVAKTDFTSGTAYEATHWKPYEKHDYAEFNPYHTWIEFINRLFGALSGLVILLMTISAVRYWKKDKTILLLSVATLLGIVFQAWLGKTVVDSNLLPLKITLHMLMALVIVALLVGLWYRSQPFQMTVNPWVKKLAIMAFVLTLVQIASGTQVRQLVDEQMHYWNLQESSQWLRNPDFSFYFHRSFSVAVLAIHLLLWHQLRKEGYVSFSFRLILLVLGFEILTGIVMYYFDFPFASQPLHLLLATVLFGLQFFFLLEQKTKS